MNPEVKKIGNKLFDKVELASQKVELGVVEDIAKMISDANSLLKTLVDDKTLLANADKAIAAAMQMLISCSCIRKKCSKSKFNIT
jgi:hypothetical protein